MGEFITSKEFVYKSPIFTVQTDKLYRLVEPFVFEWIENGDTHQILIPAGDTSNGASNPRILWTLTGILPVGVYIGAAFVHDYIYERKGRVMLSKVGPDHSLTPEPVLWSRKQCDDMFRLIMLSAEVDPATAWVMWKAVRIFGGFYWNRALSVFNIFGNRTLTAAHGG